MTVEQIRAELEFQRLLREAQLADLLEEVFSDTDHLDREGLRQISSRYEREDNR